MTSPREIGQRARALLAAHAGANRFVTMNSGMVVREEDALRAIEAALRSTGGEGWEPIETAPKDGRFLIGARFHRDELLWVKDIRWVTAEEAAELDACPSFADDYDAGWSNDGDECSPTHFMPLPAPPVSDTGGRG